MGRAWAVVLALLAGPALAGEYTPAMVWTGKVPAGSCSGYRVVFTTSLGAYCCSGAAGATWTACSPVIPDVPPLPLSGANGGLGQAQPVCGASQALTCNGTTCSCASASGDDGERVYVGSPITCTAGGATFFTFTYAVSQKIHFSGVMYVSAPSAGSTLYLGCTLPVGGVGTFSVVGEGSMGTTATPSAAAAAGQGSGTYEVGWATATAGSEIALAFRGLLYQTGAGGSGTVTCKCITSSGSPAVQVGSWSQVHYDN